MKRKTTPYAFVRLHISSIAKLNTRNTQKLIAIIAFMFSFLQMSAQYTSIPDPRFERALEDLGHDDIPEDGRVLTGIIQTIRSLDIRGERITDLTGIEDFTALTFLNCSENNLTSLDLSNNTYLEEIFLERNELTHVNIKNGTNTNIQKFVTKDNSSLTCVFVDNAAYSTTNWMEIDDQTQFIDTDYCDYTAIPDVNFEGVLEGLGYDDISGDGQVPTTLIEGITSLNISSESISDLTGIEDFLSLTSLNVSSNSLSSLAMNANTNLVFLVANDNVLTSIDITQNVSLEFINVRDNLLTSIDLSNNINLEDIEIDANNLQSLDVSANTLLTQIAADNNTITRLDLTNNTLLLNLSITDNGLETLIIGTNSTLRDFEVSDNVIQNLDLDGASALDLIDLSNNKLENLSIQNGNNMSISFFNTTGNANLSCIRVDDAAFSTTNWTDINVTTSFIDTYCRYTAIPDANFESALAAYDDIAGDGQVPTALIEKVSSLDVTNESISDLTGIEDFTALTTLVCNQNSLTSLDLSNNSNLESVQVHDNELTSIDVSNLQYLNLLVCNSNNLTSLSLTDNIALENLSIDDNTISTIDLSKNTVLEYLYAPNNSLTSLDLSANTELVHVLISGNSISTLDVTYNTKLNSLLVSGSLLTTIDLSNNTALEYLDIGLTDIEDVDLNKHVNLKYFYASGGVLKSLNVRNGTNTNILGFEINNNPDLTCVLVDDATYSTANWTNIDAQTQFTETDYCRYTAIPDANFESALDDLGYDDISGDGQVPTTLIESVTSLSIFSKSIADLTGIEAFTALTLLNCNDNSLTSLDVSNNVNLEQLLVSTNSLTAIDLSNLTKLNRLQARFNNLSSIDLSNNILLDDLNIEGNANLTSLNLSQNTLLYTIDASECSISSLDLTNLSDLLSLDLGNNQLTSVDISNNPLLIEFYISGNPLNTNLNLSELTNLKELEVINCGLIGLNIKNDTNILIDYFDATNNPDLTCVSVDDTTYATTNWTNIDNQTTFNEVNCDSTAPIITLLGDNTVTVEIGNTYTDAGATATDDTDGDLTSQISIVNPVNTSVIASYTITYNVTDAAGNAATQVTRTVNVIEPCPIIDLPTNNFVIQAYSETCSDKNNGIIFIDAAQELNYIATINSENHAFTDTLVVSDLAPGTYPICITVEGYSNCEQCFELVIQEAPVLTGKTTLNTNTGRNEVLVEVDAGTAPYTVLVNNEIIEEYTTNSFYVEVKHGDALEVVSSVVCEGKLSKSISILDDIRAYPNPTRSDIILMLPSLINSTIAIEVHNTLGVLVTSKEYSVVNGSVVIPMYQLSAGVYFVTISGDRSNVLRIVKE